MTLLEFCRKDARRINNEIPKTMEECQDYYKKIHQFHENCHIPLVWKITGLPNKDQCMAQLQDRLQEDIEYIRKVDAFTEEDIHHFVGHSYVIAYLLEDICNTAAEEVVCTET